MDLHDSCSMTPPISPMFDVLQAFQEEDDDMEIPEDPVQTDPLLVTPICFACQGSVDLLTNTHSDGLLRRGTVDRMQRCAAEKILLPPVRDLFGFSFCSQALVKDRNMLFNMLRSFFHKLEGQSSSFNQQGESSQFIEMRHDVRTFFDFIQQSLKSSTESSIKQLVPSLVTELLDLKVFIGSLNDLQCVGHAASKHGHQSNSPGHHLFHLHLETQWAIIESLHCISLLFPDYATSTRPISMYKTDSEYNTESDTVSSVTQLLLWELVAVAVNIYNKMVPSDYSRTSPFPCACVREMYILLIHTLHHRQQKLAKQSFWVSVTSILQSLVTPLPMKEDDLELDSNVFLLPLEMTCKDLLGFCWWFILHVAPLYQYDQYGIFSSSQSPLTSNYFLVQQLTKKSLLLNEATLRHHLRCCLTITALWEPNTNLVTLLWEHFYKKLNDNLRTQTADIMGHACLHKTASSLYENCNRIAENDLQGLEKDNSFQLFLRLLALHITRSPQPHQAWRQIKGRFYSKFHARRVQELTDTGIQNLACLFIVLAQVSDMEDVSGKLCELLAMVSTCPGQLSRKTAVWKAHFALMLLYVRKNHSISFIAEKLVPEFDAEARDLISTPDPSVYSALWSLISVYIDSTQEVTECSTSLALHEYKLLSPGLQALLPKCRDNDMKYLLGFIQALLVKHRNVCKSLQESNSDFSFSSNQSSVQSLRGLSDSLWQYTYGFVKQHSTTQTPPPILAEVAANFCLLVSDMPPSVHTGMKEDFNKCYVYFAQGQQVHPVVSCHFLCGMLSDAGVVQRLRESADYETGLIQAWFRCHWYLLPSSPALQQLTRLIMQLPAVQEILTCLNDTSFSNRESPTVTDFLKALGKKYLNIMDLRTKMEYREKAEVYFGDVGKHLSQVLKNCGSSDLVKNIYNIAGHMVKYCASLIYVNMRPNCMLPTLLDKLILPRSLVVQNKDLPPNVINALREYLHLFICGFGALDYKGGDAYIQRRLKEMVTHYFSKFSLNQSQTMSATLVHPFVAAVCDDSSPFRQHLIQLILRDHLAGKGPAGIVPSLQFVLEVHRKSKLANIASDVPILLPYMLNQLVEGNQHKPHLTHIVSNLLDACRKFPDVVASEEVVNMVTHVLEKALPIYQSRVFKALEAVAPSSVALFTELIPVMTGIVKLSEMKRGIGTDKTLRVAYCNLLQLLGPRGKEEKSKLLTS